MTPRIPRPRNLSIAFAAVAVLLFTAGCETAREDWASVPATPVPQANLVQHVHAVEFDAGSTRLTPDARDRLDTFLAGARADRTDSIFVAGADPETIEIDRRVQTVSAYLEHRRLAAQMPTDDFGIEPPAADTVSVVLRRYLVTLPGCPDWSGRPGYNFNNATSSNWGCATAVNFGLMLADPTDLAAPRTPGPMDGDFAVLAIQRYRAGETTPLTPEDVGTIEAQQRSGGGGEE